MRFIIMNGAGNRFGILDARADTSLALSEDQVRHLAKKGGLMGPNGADQIIIMRAPRHGGDVYMEIRNADGSEIDACGNASRCIPWLLMEERELETIALETNVGILQTRRKGASQVSVNMGEPRLEWDEIPLAEYMSTDVIDVKVGPIDAPLLARPGAVSMGNPHCVFFVENANTIAVDKIGPMIEFHPLFPQQCNVGFAQVRAPDEIRLKVWERGTGQTLACGTAACASVVAAHRQGLSERKAKVVMDGGELDIDWRADDNHIIKTGPVELEHDGQVTL